MSQKDFNALHEFRSVWRHLDLSDVQRTGRFRVNAKIAYHAPIFDETDQAEVTILFDGFEQGQIDIDETQVLDLNKCHLRFSPSFQHYTFDEDSHTLVVEGNSSKVGGEYMVRIHPVLA